MPIPLYARWWVVTLLIVGVLIGISALAVDRPNVVWSHATPHCPSCRKEVEPFGQRCPHCEGLFDWVPAPEGEMPLSSFSMSEEEFQYLGQLRERWGRDAAAAHVATRLGLSPQAAARWLTAAAPGRCGLCGGTGEDLATSAIDKVVPCELCFGAGACIACGGDRRMRLGEMDAAHGLEQFQRNAAALLRAHVPLEQRRSALRRLAEGFVKRYAGTVEAAQLPDWRAAAERAGRGQVWDSAPLAVDVARRRIDEVLDALEEPSGE